MGGVEVGKLRNICQSQRSGLFKIGGGGGVGGTAVLAAFLDVDNRNISRRRSFSCAVRACIFPRVKLKACGKGLF